MRLAQSRRGVALLLSLAILAVLAILATTFTRLMIMEDHAATNYVASARADALAAAGIDYALGCMQVLDRKQYWSWFDNAAREEEDKWISGPADRVASSQRWVYKVRIVDDASSGNYHDEIGAGLPLERAKCPPGYAPYGARKIFGIPSFYKGNTGLHNDTTTEFDTILRQVASPGERAEYDVYSTSIAARKQGRPISGWIGNAMSNQGSGPHDRYIAGTFEDWGDTFSLKILDCSSMVNVNMDTAYIKNFVNLLGEEVDYYWRKRFSKTVGGATYTVTEVDRKGELADFGYVYEGLHVLSVLAKESKKLGDWLIGTVRDQDGTTARVINSKEEIYQALRAKLQDAAAKGESFPSGLTAEQVATEDWNKLKDFVTCYGFLDTRVIKPGSLMTAELYSMHSQGPRHEARTPINMNTASNPVLTAWMRGISYHRYREEALAKGDATSEVVDFDKKFGAAKLRRLAFIYRRMAYFNPVAAWKGLEALLRARTDESQMGDMTNHKKFRDTFLSELTTQGWDQYDRDAFMAMADPNTTLNKFNPEWTVRRTVDKYDLKTWTTELSFNSMGYYEIYSLGTITGSGGSIMADRKIRGVYQIWDVVFPTTQRDFELNRVKVGYDQVKKSAITLHRGDWWGIISMPEYRNLFLDYKEGTGTGAYDSADPKVYGYCATYDGYLSYNVIDLKTFYTDDFGAGYSYPFFKNPETDKDELDGIRPVGAGSKYLRSPSRFTTARSVVSGKRLRMAVQDGELPLRYDTVSTGGAAALKRFNDGSDAFPMGFYSDNLRKRALAYPGTIYKPTDNVGAGALQFWVKPRFAGKTYDVSKGTYSGASLDRIDSWFYWEDTEERKMWIYFKNNIVHFYFSIASSVDRMLYYDPTLSYDDPGEPWKPGEWHHIHVDWGREARVFVDGEEATSGGFRISDMYDDTNVYLGDNPTPEARHLSFGGWPPLTAESMKTFYSYPDKYKSSIDWVEKHIPRTEARFTTGGTVPAWVGFGDESKHHEVSVSTDNFANATIDNVYMTTWRIFGLKQVEMAPSEFATKVGLRYYPYSYRETSRHYWQDITSFFTSYGKDITLGSVAWTNYHPTNSFLLVYLQVNDLTPDEAAAG